MTTQLASDGPHALHAATIGEAWLAVARRILADGIVSRYDDRPVREISRHANLVELAALQQRVAAAVGRPAARLVMIVKSAHVYETDLEYVLGVLADEDSGRAR